MQIGKAVNDFPGEFAVVDGFALELKFAGANPADINQAVNERNNAIELDFEFPQNAADVGAGIFGHAIKQLKREMKDVERVAELMRGDRNEVVAGGDGLGEAGPRLLACGDFRTQLVQLLI